MLGLILTILIVGAIAGALARLLVPGKQDLSIAMTVVLGVVGSFVGGLLGYLLFHKDAADGLLQPAGIIGSVIGSRPRASHLDPRRRPPFGAQLSPLHPGSPRSVLRATEPTGATRGAVSGGFRPEEVRR